MSEMRKLWSDPTFLAAIQKMPAAGAAGPAGGAQVSPASGQSDTAAATKPIQSAASPKPRKAALEKAPDIWHSTRAILDSKVNELKKAILNEFASESAELIAEIEKTVSKLDVILDKLDHRLADSLATAHSAQDPTARQVALKNSKSILADFINYVKNEPLIAHIDSNPLGIRTDLKPILTDSLKQMALAIG